MVELNISSPREQLTLGTAPFHIWKKPEGGVWLEIRRHQAGFLLRFPQLADFAVSRDGRSIACTPAPGISQVTIEHLFLNQVLLLAISGQGRLVFHGSAVEVDSGAVTFLGPSGRGKSTLAAACAARGLRFLSDDAIFLRESGERYAVQPSHPSLRLWQDSHENVMDHVKNLAPQVDYTSKVRLLAGPELAHCDQPRVLTAVYLLGDGSSQDVTFRRLTEAEALVEWTKHSFLLDVENRVLLRRHFDQVSNLANRLPCFYLDYPRRYGDLQRVIEQVVAHCETLSSLA